MTNPRVVIGGMIGFTVLSVDAVATFIQSVLNPAVAERATAGAFLAMLVFLFLFIAAGALAGYLWSMESGFLRLLSIGTLVGAVVWSYLTVTWPLTARPGAFVPPQMSVLSAVFIGAIGGALGGALLFLIGMVRTRLRD
jgi:hypothetical protein